MPSINYSVVPYPVKLKYGISIEQFTGETLKYLYSTNISVWSSAFILKLAF